MFLLQKQQLLLAILLLFQIFAGKNNQNVNISLLVNWNNFAKIVRIE